MSFDDGMQFAAKPQIDETKPVYSARYKIFSCESNDRAKVQEFIEGWAKDGIQVEMLVNGQSPEPIIEVAQEIVESEADPTIEVVTKFYGNSKEVDISESVRATIRAARGPFTQQQMADALAAANPDDEDCSDRRKLTRRVHNALTMFSNPMSALLPICEEIGGGRYARK